MREKQGVTSYYNEASHVENNTVLILSEATEQIFLHQRITNHLLHVELEAIGAHYFFRAVAMGLI